MIRLYKIENTYLVRATFDTEVSQRHYVALKHFFASFGKNTTKCFKEDGKRVRYHEFILKQPAMPLEDASDKNDVQKTNEWQASPDFEIIEDSAARRGFGWRVDPDNYNIVNCETNEVVPAKETLAELFEGEGFKISTLLPDTHGTISAIYYTRPINSVFADMKMGDGIDLGKAELAPEQHPVFTESHDYFRNLLLCHIVLKNGNVVTGESSITITDPVMVMVAKNMAFDNAFSKLMQ